MNFGPLLGKQVLLLAIIVVAIVFSQRDPDHIPRLLSGIVGQKIYVDELSLARVLRLKTQQFGAVVIIDARSREEYDNGHISGAIWYSGTVDVSPEVRLIVYCDSEICARAHEVANELNKFGKNASVYTGGWKEWQLALLPRE